MNAHYATPARARIAAFLGAVLTSAVVLGATVLGMQPKDDVNGPVIALERVTVTPTAVR